MNIYKVNESGIQLDNPILLDTIFSNIVDYEYVYISVGCKMNEHHTNAPFQMFPTFLYKINALIIFIDNFDEGSYMYEENQEIIRQYKHTHICDIYTIHNIFTTAELIELYKALCIKLKDFNDLKWMICNYIRFRTETKTNQEYQFYSDYLLQLNDVLATSEFNIFSKNIYLWHGYNNIYLHNIIYSFYFYMLFPKFEQQYSSSLTQNTVSTLLSKYNTDYLHDEISCININPVIENIPKHDNKYYDISKPQILKSLFDILKMFLDNAIDIHCELNITYDINVQNNHLHILTIIDHIIFTKNGKGKKYKSRYLKIKHKKNTKKTQKKHKNTKLYFKWINNFSNKKISKSNTVLQDTTLSQVLLTHYLSSSNPH